MIESIPPVPAVLTTPNNTTLPMRVNWRHLAMWVVLLLLFCVFLRAVRPILMPFVLGMTVAYLMDPLADRLVRWKLRRTFVAALITVSLFSLITVLVLWLGPLLYDQMVGLIAKAPSLLKHLEQSAQHDAGPILKSLHALAGPDGGQSIPNSVTEIVQNSITSMSAVVTGLLASTATLVNLVALLLLTPIVCFYFIRDWPGVLARANDLLPRAYAPTIREQLGLINKTLAAYLRGQLTVMAVLTVGYSIAFAIIGVNYSLLLGLVAGMLVIVPYIGTLISITLGLIIAYSQFGIDNDWWAMVVVYAVGQAIEGQFLTPKIIGDRVGLHPLWMLFGMLCGAVLLGFVGVLLAVPLTAVISVLVKFAIGRYLESTLYTQA